MKGNVELRCVELGEYIIANKSTVRESAKKIRNKQVNRAQRCNRKAQTH